MRRAIGMAVLVAGLLVLSSAGGLRGDEPERADEAQYRGLESFLANNEGASFLPYAQKFLAAHPDHPRTSQVLLDMVVGATILRDTAQLRQIKLQVLLQQPSSVAGAFVIRSSTVDDLNGILAERLNLTAPPLDGVTFQQIATAIDTIVRDYGPTNHQDLWAAQLLARGEPPLVPPGASPSKPDSAHQKLIRIALDPALSPREKFVQLQPLAEPKLARSYQQLLYKEQLTDEDRATLEVRTVVVKNLLRERHFAAALEELRTVTQLTDDSRMHYFHAWALASQGETAAALESLAALEQRSPKSPWTEAGKSLRPIVSSLDKSLLEHVRQVERLVQAFAASSPEVIEFVIERKSDRPLRLRWQFDFQADAFTLIAQRGEQTMLAYDVNSKGCQYYVEGDKAIRFAATGGACPLFTFQHRLAPEGGQAYHFHFNSIPQGRFVLLQSIRNLVALPTMSTTQGRIDWLRHAVRSGALPEPVTSEGGEPILRWRNLQLDRPEPDLTELFVTSDDRLRELGLGEKWRVRELAYGARSKTPLSTIVWPDLPVQQTKELQAADMMRLFSAFTSLISE